MPRQLAGVMIVLVSAANAVNAAQEVTATLDGKQVRITVDGKLFTSYKFDATQKYPYFFPVNGPLTGKSVTTETSQPYPHHHSLFFGCDKVSGGNYWQEGNERGQIISQGPKIVEGKGNRVVIEDHARWQRPGASDPFSDRRTITISAPSDRLRIIDFVITLTAAFDVRIEKTNHSLFSGRIAPQMCGEKGGRLVNAEGDVGEKATFGKKSPWCDYSGKNGETIEGMAILDWPKNQWSPCPWFTRDYGFFSPAPMYWIGAEGLTFKKGESVTLKYRVIVHASNEKDADIAGLFKQWIENP